MEQESWLDRHHKRMMENREYREAYEEASAELAQGTENHPCGCVTKVSDGEVIFGPVGCEVHPDDE